MTLMMGTSPANGADKAPTSCNNIKTKCAEALDAADQVINIYAMQNEAAEEQIQILMAQSQDAQKRALELKQSNEAWYRSPYLYIGIGLVTGVLITK